MFRCEDVLVRCVRSLHALEEWRVNCEHDFDRLERSFGRFGIEQIDDWYPQKVESGEQKVGSALRDMSVYTAEKVFRKGAHLQMFKHDGID